MTVQIWKISSSNNRREDFTLSEQQQSDSVSHSFDAIHYQLYVDTCKHLAFLVTMGGNGADFSLI